MDNPRLSYNNKIRNPYKKVRIDKAKVINASLLDISYITRKYNETNIPFGWRDFLGNSSGYSTTWITSFIILNLNSLLPEFILNNFRYQYKNFIQIDNGVGYSLKTPSDCDSTIFFLRACLSLNIDLNEIQQQIDFILKHQCSNGGFRTFLDEEKIKNWKGHKYSGFRGWIADHVCVSSAVLELLTSHDFFHLTYSGIIDRLIKYLSKKQHQDGYLNSYWWNTKYYSTIHTLNALLNLNRTEINLYKRGKEYVRQSFRNGYWTNGINEKPCVFSTALCLSFLINESYTRNKSLIDKGIRYLLSSMDNKNKCWASNPILKIPDPNSLPDEGEVYKMNGKGVGSCSNDPDNLYTTALIIKVLRNFFKKDHCYV